MGMVVLLNMAEPHTISGRTEVKPEKVGRLGGRARQMRPIIINCSETNWKLLGFLNFLFSPAQILCHSLSISTIGMAEAAQSDRHWLYLATWIRHCLSTIVVF